MKSETKIKYCLGFEGHTCRANLTSMVHAKRCPACKKQSDLEAGRRYRRKMRAGLKDSPFAIEHSLTDEQLSKQVRQEIRWGEPNAIIAERYGITRERIREINCAHYQRRARIAA